MPARPCWLGGLSQSQRHECKANLKPSTQELLMCRWQQGTGRAGGSGSCGQPQPHPKCSPEVPASPSAHHGLRDLQALARSRMGVRPVGAAGILGSPPSTGGFPCQSSKKSSGGPCPSGTRRAVGTNPPVAVPSSGSITCVPWVTLLMTIPAPRGLVCPCSQGTGCCKSTAAAQTGFFLRSLKNREGEETFPFATRQEGTGHTGQSPEHPTAAFAPVGPNAAQGSAQQGMMIPSQAHQGCTKGHNSKLRHPKPCCPCYPTPAPASNTKQF